MAEELKNWFDDSFFREFAEHIHGQYKKFDRRRFIDAALDGLDGLALMDRMRRTTDLLHEQMPGSYVKTLDILKPVAPLYDGTFKGMLFPDYVGRHGREHIDLSLDALDYFTRHSSSEFAIREFFKIDFEKTMTRMTGWAKSDNHHVRRLASEGSRPRLPWSFRIKELMADPTPVKPILDTLNADPEPYVRKSVANHLNDISKDNPETMLDWVEAWDRSQPETAWITKHAARGLLKRGHPRAFGLFGFEGKPKVSAERLALENATLQLGDTLAFSFDLVSGKSTPQKLAVDYVIHYMKKNGRTAPKVFKLKEFELPAKAAETVTKSQKIEDFTTRKHYAGEHGIDIVINGAVVASATFDLKT